MDLQGKRVTVVGMGRTSVALARLLVREGACPFVTEENASAKLEPFKAELEALGVSFETGGHTEAAFADAALVIPSPGVSPNLAPIRAAVERGAELMGEMELASRYCAAPIIAVTGTNGKTTTTELLRSLIAGCGYRVTLAGNNALPFSAAVLEPGQPDYVVLEVSSYQLETIKAFRPWIGCVLNVTPDHLARHGTVENYAAAKSRMFENQGAGDVAVVNHDDAFAREMGCGGPLRLPFSLKERISDGLWIDQGLIRHGDAIIAKTSDTILPGRHNLENVLAALAAMRAGGFDGEKTLEQLRVFRGVEHRIEWVGEWDGVTWYNDSKSTNLDSLRVALESFDRPVVLIAGGEGKGGDYGILRELVAEHVVEVITIGQDAPLIEAAFRDAVPVRRAPDMEDAVLRARAAARPGQAVLLSPGCASFDMFDDFEHRGRVFKDCVRRAVIALPEDLETRK